MKTLVFSLLVVASVALSSAVAQTTPAPKTTAKAVAADPLKTLRSDKDEMADITFYSSKSSPKFRNANGFYLYFGKTQSGNFTPLRLVAQYFSDDWLFVTSAWAKADGVRVDVPSTSSRMGWERDNGSGNIWEWSDYALSNSTDIAAVRQIASAKAVTVRFDGKQYYDDKKLTEKQLAAMREVIAVYEAVTRKPWK